MLGSEKYKQFAADCIRIAEKLGCEDKERLLKIADAWTERALEVERQQKKSGDRVQPDNLIKGLYQHPRVPVPLLSLTNDHSPRRPVASGYAFPGHETTPPSSDIPLRGRRVLTIGNR